MKYQELKIQEHNDQVPVGNIPRSMTVIARYVCMYVCMYRGYSAKGFPLSSLLNNVSNSETTHTPLTVCRGYSAQDSLPLFSLHLPIEQCQHF